MARPSKYPQELRERAVRMVAEVRPSYGSEYEAITQVAQKLGIGTPETLRKWVRQAQTDAGRRPGDDDGGVRGAQAAAQGERRAAACQ